MNIIEQGPGINEINRLRYKKLILDLKYWKEESEIKKEMIQSMDTEFADSITNFLKENPELDMDMVKWEELNAIKIKVGEDVSVVDDSNVINCDHKKYPTDETLNLKPSSNQKKPDFFKKLYREITKKTHPDKLINYDKEHIDEKNILYKSATNFYNSNRFESLLYIADELRIDIDIDIDSISLINNYIDKYKKDSEFIEDSHIWKWYWSDDIVKSVIVQNFIMKNKYVSL